MNNPAHRQVPVLLLVLVYLGIGKDIRLDVGRGVGGLCGRLLGRKLGRVVPVPECRCQRGETGHAAVCCAEWAGTWGEGIVKLLL